MLRLVGLDLIIFSILLILHRISADKISYAGYSVVEATPKNNDELTWLESDSPCSVLGEWVGNGVGLLCSRLEANLLRQQAKNRGIKTTFSTRHLGRQIDKEEEQNSRADLIQPHKRQKKRILTHEEFVNYATIQHYLDSLQELYPYVNVSSIGKSIEGRDLKLVTINGGRNLPKIFIDAGIHAREWISPASTLFFIDKLTKVLKRQKTHSTKTTGRRSLTDEIEWHIVPLMNPDGYEHSRNKDRMWRKNRRVNPNSNCVGVDLNRNFPEGYGIGSSTRACSEVFQGPNPLSEPESIALNNHIEQTSGIRAAVSVHSFGNVLIFPWGYTETAHPQKAALSELANVISDTIYQKYEERYKPGTAKEVFGSWGVAGGATDDYYITKGIPYSFTFELPQTDSAGNHGFLLPPSNIKKVGNQLFLGFMTLAGQVLKS
ncbi:carboxypeptidase B [Eurytemora carolleeae]|uniref:carboxypeptidase B n=1 Tax=Eurytemora carolleeae TaxID=1294199 RepID=UPI000C75F951|nr:carboxypeptidase B [Eurytemora carolleeae]|eukprot:XP_023320641.1 carboxypeptidase B-like [Eurytemora affinis]